MEKADLEAMHKWASGKLEAGQEPPWSWFQYMKLREVLEDIIGGMGAVRTESLPQSAGHPGRHLQLVGSTDLQDGAPRHSVGLPIQLPT